MWLRTYLRKRRIGRMARRLSEEERRIARMIKIGPATDWGKKESDALREVEMIMKEVDRKLKEQKKQTAYYLTLKRRKEVRETSERTSQSMGGLSTQIKKLETDT